MKPEILCRTSSAPIRNQLQENFCLYDMLPGGSIPPAEALSRIRIAVTTGVNGLNRDIMDAMPELGLICCTGTGYENVDVGAALARGVVVTHGAGVNSSAVADHAMAMLLALMRDLGGFDRAVREGRWRDSLQPRPTPSGKRLGLVGLGSIGERIARRAEAFEMTVAYHKRQPRSDVPWRYAPSVIELAEQSDILAIAAPGGASTWHMINSDVLQALGPEGFLINVGRGSLVDTDALVEALATKAIRGAALDVFEGEPTVPSHLLAQPNTLLSPHVASWAPEVQVAAVSLVRENIARFLRREPVLTPVPEMQSACRA